MHRPEQMHHPEPMIPGTISAGLVVAAAVALLASTFFVVAALATLFF
jgi:hypothetical protein